ncbi:uncharacterized protein K02A2.6-like [Uranotaenia lowii]|uniref:uncharacterized protein K02A2.6-like n=1 Tax=Uranotaenia lowii TaxID=190385 RepID=UPI00247A5D98|nr:uncharacterized protein K02A2.6-like [Uranotaenia lowii]
MSVIENTRERNEKKLHFTQSEWKKKRPIGNAVECELCGENLIEQDNELQLILSHLNSKKRPSSLIEFALHRQSIHHIGSLLYKDNRLILPKALRIKALSSAHAGHIGEVAMKRILRQFFWWPCISKEAELFVKIGKTCTMLAKKNPPIPISSRTLPDGPWEELQIDFLSIPGFGTGEFLIIVDTYSRFLSVCEMRRTDADSTNAALCYVFKLWGLPKIIQSDNGPPFQSSAFCNYWEEKAVMIRKSIPLSPQSNGCVEHQNQGIIKALAASRIDVSNWRVALHKYVHNHNTLTPQARLNVTPFKLLVGWKFRGTFPSLWHTDNVKSLNKEEVKDRDTEAKFTSKSYADTRRGAKDSNLQVGDKVLLAQQKETKTDPNFSSEYYHIVAKNGGKAVVMRKNGVQYTRTLDDLKKANLLDNTDQIPNPETVNDEIELNASTDTEQRSTSRELRSRRIKET